MQALITTSKMGKFMKDKNKQPEPIEALEQTIESEIEELEKQLEALQEKQKQNRQDEQDADRQWAQRVCIARKLQHKKLEGRAKAKKMANLSPARLQRLRALGKI